MIRSKSRLESCLSAATSLVQDCFLTFDFLELVVPILLSAGSLGGFRDHGPENNSINSGP
jgi:hypothetical protein